MSRYLVASDAGGTMTDVIIVDEQGRFVIGKAPTTRYDESIGYMESLDDAMTYWGKSLEKDGREFCPQVETAIYTGTAMLNTLINLDGLKTGLLVTKGFEDMIVQGRGKQSFIGLDWSEVTHMQYRKHGPPLVPRKLTRGVTERIDMFGTPVIPIYEHEVRQGVRELLEEGVEALAVVFLYSFVNPAHELRVQQIAEEIIKESGRSVYLALSSQVAPVQREISRANATVVQAYATQPARRQFLTVESKLASYGYSRSLKTVLCYGGVTNIRYPRLFETMMSGPVGGLMGAHYLGQGLGIDNIVCSDMGGTSFDAGAITAGILPMDREPPFMQMYVNVPMLDIRSIGAGTGTYIRIDPTTNRIKLGPDSAGGTPGPVFQETGNETPTIGDCDMLLGIINPDYYLGGRVKVNKEKSLRIFTEKVAAPLGLDPYVAAEQCTKLINIMMREHLVRSLMLGYDIRDYVLLGYGGAGPMHLCGYAAEYPWKGVATAPHAAAFSAWGGACMDYAHRRHKSVSAMLPPGADANAKMQAATLIGSAWHELEGELLKELLSEGFTREQITLRQIAYIRYYGQLEDVEVESPVPRLDTPAHVDQLVTRFEEIFAKMFTLAGQPPMPTYLITEVAVVAQVATLKPQIIQYDLEGKRPAKRALKAVRRVFQNGHWHDAKIYEMDELRPGNELSGLAVIEAPTTTLFVPPDWRLKIDAHNVYWLTQGEEKMTGKSTPRKVVPRIKPLLAEHARRFQDTGHLFGLETLRRKQEDPGTYEAVWHILLNTMDAAWEVGCKVSASPIAAEGGDALWALHLPTGEAICASKGITAHPGVLSEFIRQLIDLDYETYPGIRAGDVFENNDPHYGGIHSVDFDGAIPIFYKDELVAWASAVSHVMDGGSVTPGSIGFLNPDCFSDGVPVSMERVGEADRYYPWYEMRIRSRTRVPDWVMGDARGRLAGCITIRERVLQLIAKYGIDYFKDVCREYIEDSRRYAEIRVRTQTVPGRIRKSNFKDLAMAGKRVILPHQNVDCLFNLPLEVRIDGDAKLHVSMRGASRWVPFGENIHPSAIPLAMLNAYSHVVGFDMFNSGPMATWEFEMPPAGSWANPFPVNYYASSGVSWAPTVMWLSSLYETFGRLYFSRGFIEEMAAGAATTMTAEFSGINQHGMFVAGLTLEQASNGSPARGMADGENAAWCIYTPNADFGNAEVTELYYPILFLGRHIEPDSGGYGKFRAGLGHTAVWMVKNTPGIEYQCGCAGMRSKVVANHGMFGAYPTWPDRSSYASDTNMKELIDAQKPLVHERGEPTDPTLAKNVIARVMETNAVAPFVTPHQLHDYDLIIHPISGAQAMGDPLERDPALVKADLDAGWTREWVATGVHGVIATRDARTKEWTVDEAATARKRDEIRQARKARGIPFREWWEQERQRILAKENMASAVLDMWRGSLELSPDYGQELRAFWQLPAEFTF